MASHMSYDYRVKFKDIRVRPSGDDKSRAKAVEENRVCEHKGCDLHGDCKAPKHGEEGEFHWFCQRHAAEYNKSWNFFDGMTDSEAATFREAASYGHRKTWKFGTGPMGGTKAARANNPHLWEGSDFLGAAPAHAKRKAEQARGRTRLQVRALNELDLPESATAPEIRERYSEYVKRFHPDANGGDRSSEHKLSRVIRAFKTLKAAGLTKD